MKARLLVTLPFVLAPAACGDGETTSAPPTTNSSSGALSDAGPPTCGAPLTPPQKIAGACEITLETPLLESVQHLPEGTAITYCSNPPSSGRHYPVWAAFQEYSAPVEWPYLVHSMEHGGVVLLYKCDGGCPEIVEQLRKVRDDAAADPLCSSQPTPKRFIIAPSTTIATKVAAAAWGATYQADCVDKTVLDTFVRDHYAKGPENLCNPGRTF